MDGIQSDCSSREPTILAPVIVSIFRTGGIAGMRIEKTAMVKPEGYYTNHCFTADLCMWRYIVDLHRFLKELKDGEKLVLPDSAMVIDQFNYHIALTDATGETIDGHFQGQRVPKIVPECFNTLPLPE